MAQIHARGNVARALSTRCIAGQMMRKVIQPAQTKQINILLTNYPHNASRWFRRFTKSRYGHASIGLNGMDGDFYSFVVKGFRIEQPRLHPTFKGEEVPCSLYTVDVPADVHHEMELLLQEHARQAKAYAYSNWGLLLCIMRIPIKLQRRYFCSQFVAEVLEHGVDIKKSSTLYLPDDFMKLQELKLQFNGTLKELLLNPVHGAPTFWRSVQGV